MKPEYKPFVDALIELAIREDIGDGDHTSLSCIPAGEHGRMRLLCKQEVIGSIPFASTNDIFFEKYLQKLSVSCIMLNSCKS